jgi:hypothetical protein
MTPTSSPAVPYNTGLLAIDCGGGIYTGGVSVSVLGTPIPIVSTGGTIGNGSCVNLMIRNNTGIIYQINYGGGFTECLTPGNNYDEVRTINFNYNMAIGLYGGYDYLEQYWNGGILVSGATKQTAIVNPAADLGNGCPIQDLDLVVRFYIQGGIVPSATPTQTPTITPTITPTQTSTMTPTPSATPCICFPAGSGFNNTQNTIATIEKDSSLNRIYVGGAFTSYNGISNVANFTALDYTTSNLIDGFTGTTTNGVGNIIKIQTDNKILVGGAFNLYKGVDCPDNLIRINTDGTIDSAFSVGIGTGFTGSVNDIYVEPSGKIMVGGLMTGIQGNTIGLICRLNSDGTLDTTFSAATPGFVGTGGAFNGVQEIISDGGTGYYVSGNFNTFNGVACNDVVRLNSDGSLNTSFNASIVSGNTRIISIDLQTSTGYIIIGNYLGITAVNTSGTTEWSNGVSGMVETNYVKVQSDNKIIVGGRNGGSGADIVRVNADGTTDITFTSPNFSFFNQPNRGVMDIITDYANSCYIIGGSWTSVNGYIGTQILRIYNNGALDQCNPIPVSPTPTPTNTKTPTPSPT